MSKARKCPKCGANHYTMTRNRVVHRTFKNGYQLASIWDKFRGKTRLHCEECGHWWKEITDYQNFPLVKTKRKIPYKSRK